MQNIFEHVQSLLMQHANYVVDSKLLKNSVVEAVLKLDPTLLSILKNDDLTRKYFFQDVDGTLIFDKVKLQQFVNNKQFLPDSYTAFKNKIGLTNGSQFVNEGNNIVLSFPYKDCVLEGGQSTSDEKRSEIFWNETLAPDQVDVLLSPKVFSGFKRVTADGETNAADLSINDSYLIHGNNLLILHSLKQVYRNKVKLIYIDPPYNTGNDDFGYNDRFNHSAWLTFMKNRLEVARDLLTPDGSIWINIDDIEAHYLKVLYDELFGRDNFVANVIWQKKFAPQNDAKYFSDNHDHILVYAKDKARWVPNLLERSEASKSRYTNPDNDPRGPWSSSDLTVKTYSAAYDYPIQTPSGRTVNPPKGVCWRVPKEGFAKLVTENRVWFGESGNNVPRLKRFLADVKNGQTPMTIWPHTEVGHNQEAKQELNKLLDTELFKTPKPERLLKRVIQIGSNPGDIVLDFFAGSGTTAAAALKMGRRFITTEQMDYIDTVTKHRLVQVLKGEQGGISNDTQWQGGGSFIYSRLMPLAERLLADANEDATDERITIVYQKIINSPWVNYRVDTEAGGLTELLKLSPKDRVRALYAMVDLNKLYLPLSEMDDADYQLGEDTKDANRRFYTL